MAHTDFSEGKKHKPRGRPFPKGNKRGKLENNVLDANGHESGDKGEIIDINPISLVTELANQEQEIETSETSCEPEKNSKDLELIDSIEFKNGQNTLTIRFSKKHNRMFRIQVFLNNESEIRPVTYTGASTGYAFWNLLKGSVK